MAGLSKPLVSAKRLLVSAEERENFPLLDFPRVIFDVLRGEEVVAVRVRPPLVSQQLRRTPLASILVQLSHLENPTLSFGTPRRTSWPRRLASPSLSILLGASLRRSVRGAFETGTSRHLSLSRERAGEASERSWAEGTEEEDSDVVFVSLAQPALPRRRRRMALALARSLLSAERRTR